MIGVLQRLVAQARASSVPSPQGIRSAMKVQAQPPLGISVTHEIAVPARVTAVPSPIPESSTQTRVMTHAHSLVPGRDAMSNPPDEAARPSSVLADRELRASPSVPVALEATPVILPESQVSVPKMLLPPLPEPAIGRHETPAITPARLQAELLARTESAAGGGPNEVHVHIGRIDVTAIQDSVPARRGRAPQRPTVALADYLSRRKHS